MKYRELLAVVAAILVREQQTSVLGLQFEGAVDDAAALLKVVEMRTRRFMDRPDWPE
jgi:hypothetical protein